MSSSEAENTNEDADKACRRELLEWPGRTSRLDLSLPDPADNLALDEALLLTVNDDPESACVRFWELREYAVIVGRSNKIETEVDVAACERDGVRIFRRCSGGGTVLAGPGCLMFTVVVPATETMHRMGVPRVTCDLLGKIVRPLSEKFPEVAIRGTSDLVLGEHKFAGNAQRWIRHAMLHHGSILYDFNLPKIATYLKFPSRQPEYRSLRGHLDFVRNIPLDRAALCEVIAKAWHSESDQDFVPPYDLTAKLAKERYRQEEWTRSL